MMQHKHCIISLPSFPADLAWILLVTLPVNSAQHPSALGATVSVLKDAACCKGLLRVPPGTWTQAGRRQQCQSLQLQLEQG